MVRKMSRLAAGILAVILLLGWCPLALSQDKESKKSYEARIDKQLRALDKKIDQLKAKSAKMTEEAKKDFNEMMADFKKKREATEAKLQEVKKASAQKWEELKSGMNSAIKDLEEAYDRAAARFKERG
jgi:uncharacterized protein YlxW (UPF0749 family)